VYVLEKHQHNVSTAEDVPDEILLKIARGELLGPICKAY
jgi:hypothetical protein